MKVAKYFCLSLLLITSHIAAKTGDDQQPIEVEADSLEVRDNDNISIYSGNVKLTQGSLVIHSDKLTLYFNQDKIVTLMEMIGAPAKFKQLDDDQREVTGQANKMEFRESESTLLLLDNAKLNQGADIIESDKIILNTRSNSIQAGSEENEGRVRMLIQPKQPE